MPAFTMESMQLFSLKTRAKTIKSKCFLQPAKQTPLTTS